MIPHRDPVELAVATLKGVDPEEIAAVTHDNFFRLFTKATPPAE